MPVMTGGQALVGALAAHGVDTIFGMPGSHSLVIYDALVDCPAIQHISVRHEQGAAFMADGYARVTGKVGVCLTTTGPAALNTFGSLATSYGDSIPVLLLCTQVPSDFIGQNKGFYHEIPHQMGMLERVTKYSVSVRSGQQIADSVREAFRIALDGRPRPVALELPYNVLNAEWEVTISDPAARTRSKPGPNEVEAAMTLITQAKRPIIWIGGGATTSGVSTELRQLAELIQAPVLSTPLGKGVLSADHPLDVGFLAVKTPVQVYMKTCDLMIAIGTRLSFISTERWTLPFPQKMIHIDIDPEVIGRNYPVTLGIVADARETLKAIVERLEVDATRCESRESEVRALKEQVRTDWESDIPREYQLIQRIRSALPRETIVVGGPTMASYLTWRMFDLFEPRHYPYPLSCATVGYALPAALGAKLANPDRPVVAMCGDGGFMLTCQELATAVQYGVNVVIMLFNDNGYEVLRLQQQERFGRYSEVDLKNPDFVAMARSFGAESWRVEVDQLREAIRPALALEKMVLLEIPVTLAADVITA